MLIHDYILNSPAGEIGRQRQTETDDLASEAVAVCRRAMADPAVIGDTGVGIWIDWREMAPGCGCLTCYADDGRETPLSVSVYLTEPERRALQALHGVIAAVGRKSGVEPSPDWIDMVLDYPAVVTAPLPSLAPLPDKHILAGDLIQCWAAAYFEA